MDDQLSKATSRSLTLVDKEKSTSAARPNPKPAKGIAKPASKAALARRAAILHFIGVDLHKLEAHFPLEKGVTLSDVIPRKGGESSREWRIRQREVYRFLATEASDYGVSAAIGKATTVQFKGSILYDARDAVSRMIALSNAHRQKFLQGLSKQKNVHACEKGQKSVQASDKGQTGVQGCENGNAVPKTEAMEK